MKNRQIQIGGKVAAAPKFHVPPQLWWLATGPSPRLATGPLRHGSSPHPSLPPGAPCRPVRVGRHRRRPSARVRGSPPPLPQRAARSYNKKEERKED